MSFLYTKYKTWQLKVNIQIQWSHLRFEGEINLFLLIILVSAFKPYLRRGIFILNILDILDRL